MKMCGKMYNEKSQCWISKSDICFKKCFVSRFKNTFILRDINRNINRNWKMLSFLNVSLYIYVLEYRLTI